jgi:uncharacterized membrane protein
LSHVRLGLAVGLTLMLVLTGSGSAVEAQGIPRYTVIDLGDHARASDINDSGQIVGSSDHPILWDHGSVTNLDPRSGTTDTATTADALNNHAQVVGTLSDPLDRYPALCDTLAPPPRRIAGASGAGIHPVGAAYDINDAGQVVGWSGDGAILYDHGAITILAPDGFASGINAAGKVVGSAVWDHGTTTSLSVLSGATFSVANRINNRDQYVGYSGKGLGEDRVVHAAFWDHGVIVGLHTLPGDASSSAYDINDNGQIVGESAGHAVLWDSATVEPLSLGELPGTSTSSAHAINASGQIVGTSGDHAVLWQKRQGTQPYSVVPPAVP